VILQVVLTVAVAHNLLHCRVVEDPIRVMMSQATVLGDVSSAAVKIVNQASVNDEVGGPCNNQVLDLEVTSLLAATIGHISATSCAIARDLYDCFNSRQKMLVPVVHIARVFGASVQMIQPLDADHFGMSTIGQRKGQAKVVQCQDVDRTMTAIPARSNVNQLYIVCASTSCNEVRAKLWWKRSNGVAHQVVRFAGLFIYGVVY
jgi:hypothetical protein